MDNKELLKIAMQQAANDSLTQWKDENVFLLYNERRNEFTAVAEHNLQTFMQAEPAANNVCAFRNGELLK